LPAALGRVIHRTSRLLLSAACSALAACGSKGPTQQPIEPGSPGPAADAVAWGFFAYTNDFVGGLTGARLSRATGILWTDVERVPGSGSYDWSQLDARARNAQAAGMNAVLVLKTGNGSSFSDATCFQRVEAGASSGGLPDGRELSSCPIRAAMESAWSQMVTELVERYDGDGTRDMPGLAGNIRVDIEVENEAANPQYWDYGEPDRTLAADHYLRLLDLSYRAKQAADPQTRVILAGLIHPNLLARCDGRPSAPGCGSSDQQNLTFTKRILGRPDIFDGVDVHFFVYYHFEPDYIDNGFQWVVGQMQQRGYQRPIYSLEWTGASMLHVADGYRAQFASYFPYSGSFPSVESFQAMYVALDQPGNETYRRWFDTEQAKEFGKLFSNMLALGASRLVHVQYSDYRPGAVWNNPWWNWQGIVKVVGGSPIRKPSYYTFNILSERLGGFTAARRLAAANGARLYEFTFPAKDPSYVLWTDGPAGVVDLSSVVPRRTLRVTYLVTDLTAANEPVLRPEQNVAVTSVPVADAPVLLTGVD
jgi:hypothetical protein